MSASKKSSDDSWDPDTAPEFTDEVWERAQITIGGKVIRPARGTLTRWFTEEELAEQNKPAN